ncbi:MAG: hypothetical protein RBQ96_06695, partial [Candidatus Methanomethylophilaceae archaeon]|nr:hypothetical protein [Candidatus Methanomethylophilaceae archaeon]
EGKELAIATNTAISAVDSGKTLTPTMLKKAGFTEAEAKQYVPKQVNGIDYKTKQPFTFQAIDIEQVGANEKGNAVKQLEKFKQENNEWRQAQNGAKKEQEPQKQPHESAPADADTPKDGGAQSGPASSTPEGGEPKSAVESFKEKYAPIEESDTSKMSPQESSTSKAATETQAPKSRLGKIFFAMGAMSVGASVADAKPIPSKVEDEASPEDIPMNDIDTTGFAIQGGFNALNGYAAYKEMQGGASKNLKDLISPKAYTEGAKEIVGDFVDTKSVKAVGSELVENGIGAGAKQLGKATLKKLPMVGLAMGAGFAVSRAKDGDYIGASMEFASGALSMIPGIGTAASVAIDAALMKRDMDGNGASQSQDMGMTAPTDGNATAISLQPNFTPSVLEANQGAIKTPLSGALNQASGEDMPATSSVGPSQGNAPRVLAQAVSTKAETVDTLSFREEALNQDIEPSSSAQTAAQTADVLPQQAQAAAAAITDRVIKETSSPDAASLKTGVKEDIKNKEAQFVVDSVDAPRAERKEVLSIESDTDSAVGMALESNAVSGHEVSIMERAADKQEIPKSSAVDPAIQIPTTAQDMQTKKIQIPGVPPVLTAAVFAPVATELHGVPSSQATEVEMEPMLHPQSVALTAEGNMQNMQTFDTQALSVQTEAMPLTNDNGSAQTTNVSQVKGPSEIKSADQKAETSRGQKKTEEPSDISEISRKATIAPLLEDEPEAPAVADVEAQKLNDISTSKNTQTIGAKSAPLDNGERAKASLSTEKAGKAETQIAQELPKEIIETVSEKAQFADEPARATQVVAEETRGTGSSMEKKNIVMSTVSGAGETEASTPSAINHEVLSNKETASNASASFSMAQVGTAEMKAAAVELSEAGANKIPVAKAETLATAPSAAMSVKPAMTKVTPSAQRAESPSDPGQEISRLGFEGSNVQIAELLTPQEQERLTPVQKARVVRDRVQELADVDAGAAYLSMVTPEENAEAER